MRRDEALPNERAAHGTMRPHCDHRSMIRSCSAVPCGVKPLVRMEPPPTGYFLCVGEIALGADLAHRGKCVQLRQYMLELNEGSRGVVFHIIDAPFRHVDFNKSLHGFASAEPDGTVTDSRHFVLDGLPADDGRITATIEGTPAVYLVRLVADKGYLVGIFTFGRITEEKALLSFHQQVLGTLHLI